MAHNETRSLQEIRRETEQTRAGLTETVEQLRATVTETASDIRERVRPTAIKAEVSNYIRSRGEQLLDDIAASARENPMQAAAVGASLAYPMLRLVRAIPAPILMVGAGLYLASSKGGKAITGKASEAAADLSDDLVHRARDVHDQLNEAACDVKEYAAEKLGELNQAVSSGARQAGQAVGTAGVTLASGSEHVSSTTRSAADSIGERNDEFREQAARAAGLARDFASDFTSNAAAAAQQAAGTAKDTAFNTAQSVRDTASSLRDRAGNTLSEAFDKNPLLVAGVGLLIGGVIASALPRTELEEEFVAGASSSVKRRVRAAASEGYDAAKNAATEAAERAARQAEAEDLDPDALGRKARDFGQRVRRVAETAVTTAFEPPENDQQPGSQGGEDYG